MIKALKFKTVVSLVIFYFSSLAFPVLAAEVYFETQGEEFGLEKNFEVKVLLDTEGETVNAVEGEIVFPTNNLLLQEINDGGSFINLWIKKPSFDGNSVVFSGILPGGYEGKDLYLFSLVLRGKELGEVTVDVINIRVLRNEPPGSTASTRVSSLKLQIKEESAAPEFITPEDSEPPEPFTARTAQDPNIFDGKWFLVFAAQDKVSGIARYFVYETKQKKDVTQINAKRWIEAESPYLLKDQKLQSYIYVKAVDKAGNERITALVARNQPSWPERYFLHIIFGIIIIVGGSVVFIRRKALRSKYLDSKNW